MADAIGHSDSELRLGIVETPWSVFTLLTGTRAKWPSAATRQLLQRALAGLDTCGAAAAGLTGLALC